jgi:mRNA interferase MazF
MMRGDVVVVAAPGDFGKARPAVVVQTNALPEDHPCVIVCQMTSVLLETTDFRVLIEPSDENSLRVPSQVMVDKPVSVARARVSQRIGRLTASDLNRLDVALAFVMGLAD